MAYLEQGNWRDRPLAVAGVVAIHAGIGLVLVYGLQVATRIVEVTPPPIAINVEDDVKPPDDVVVPPEPAPTQTPTYVPTPPLDLNTAGTVIDPVPIPLPPAADIFTPGPVSTPTPSLGFDPVAARPANDRASWVTTGDYPARDIRQENEGVTGFRVVVGTDGRVKSCEITSSSGFATLDQATCRNVEKRARFDAARDANGEKVVGTYSSKVRWQIPD